ncbi:MAG: lipopolysaccharide biosynthesis protein [Methylovirgula sp.]
MKVLIAFFCNIIFNFVIGLLVAKFLGPAEYGRFALAFATATIVQAAFLDWLRLGATRFYSEKVRSEEPALRATLDVSFIVVACALLIGGALLLVSNVRFSLSNGMIGLALGIAITNGFYDYNTALVRARFNDRIYTRLIIVKNILAFCLTGGGAFWFHSARMALIGSIISIAGSLIAAHASLRDPGANPQCASRDTVKTVLHYALPIVAANLLYVAIPLANRSIITILYGFSETGQFSLAFDLGNKAVQAIGSTLDVVLFQIAVAAHERDAGEAKAQVARNLAIVFAIVLPSCTGLWLILPSIEQVIVPTAYRGPFGDLLTLMMGGFFCSALIQFGLNPFFQIAKRTAPLIAAAAVGCVVDGILLFVLPHSGDLFILPNSGQAWSFAVAQTGAYAAALCALIFVASLSKPEWPSWRQIATVIFATAAMAAALLPLRDHDPGFKTLLEQVMAGTVIYSFFVAVFDIAGLRTILYGKLRAHLARWQTPVTPPQS